MYSYKKSVLANPSSRHKNANEYSVASLKEAGLFIWAGFLETHSKRPWQNQKYSLSLSVYTEPELAGEQHAAKANIKTVHTLKG